MRKVIKRYWWVSGANSPAADAVVEKGFHLDAGENTGRGFGSGSCVL